MKISLFASSVRPQLYPAFFKSLESEPLKNEIEVVFAGNALPSSKSNNVCKLEDILKACSIKEVSQGKEYVWPNIKFKYIQTENIKPSQCYEIARRHCTGEVVVWTADDAECVGGILSKAYEYWKSKNNEKLILSLQIDEYGVMCDMTGHVLRGRGTPIMAPIGMMSRKFLDELGGLDRRYVCGQYENDIVMRALNEGAEVEIFKDGYVWIDHKEKHSQCSNEKFMQRTFALGYPSDRRVLEWSWVTHNRIEKVDGKFPRVDEFEPFSKDLSLTQSECLPEEFKNKWV